jgi:homoserine dehydrogenase
MEPAPSGHRRAKAYLRFVVADRPGVLAELAAAMRDAGVSIESLIQKGSPAHLGAQASAEPAEPVLIAMVTHEGPERCITEALRLLEGSPSLVEPPLVMPILGD